MSQEADHNSKAGRTVEEIYAERKRALEQEIRNTKLSAEAKQALGRNSPDEAWFDLVEIVREAAEEYYRAAEQLIPEELYPDSPLACTRLDRLVVSLLSNRPNAPLAINQLVESNPDLDLSHIRSLPVLLPLKAIVKMLLTKRSRLRVTRLELDNNSAEPEPEEVGEGNSSYVYFRAGSNYASGHGEAAKPRAHREAPRRAAARSGP